MILSKIDEFIFFYFMKYGSSIWDVIYIFLVFLVKIIFVLKEVIKFDFICCL